MACNGLKMGSFHLITQDKAPNQFNNTHNKFSTNLYTTIDVIPCSRKIDGQAKQGFRHPKWCRIIFEKTHF